jgi:hypothetical protein
MSYRVENKRRARIRISTFIYQATRLFLTFVRVLILSCFLLSSLTRSFIRSFSFPYGFHSFSPSRSASCISLGSFLFRMLLRLSLFLFLLPLTLRHGLSPLPSPFATSAPPPPPPPPRHPINRSFFSVREVEAISSGTRKSRDARIRGTICIRGCKETKSDHRHLFDVPIIKSPSSLHPDG